MALSCFEEQVVQHGHRLGLDLHAFRDAAQSFLGAIPSTGFFRTYTNHSIRHCEEMFNILTWLIPDDLRRELKYPEHALLTLAVYTHDLGMLATEEEFEKRTESPVFQRFELTYTRHYDTTSQENADHNSWDHFLFEEYVRSTHAQRICDWLTGRISGSPQAQELQALLRRVSGPFAKYLAAICRSHHLNNLHDTNVYPHDAVFGNSPDDRANIQFIAVVLRLADILHMSRDRTPPLEFRIISPRNPVSAREWAKQLQVSGVAPAAGDPTEIRVEALCTDHRMFFYLHDFIRTVNDELQRCRGWLSGAPGEIARRYYLTHRMVSSAGIRAEGFLAEKFQLELDQRKVIDLLMGHNLYGDAKVAIRELVQNAIDAVRVRLRESADYTPSISVHLDRQAGTLTVLDNGIGMDLDVIRRHFLTVGDSYYQSQEFRRRCPGYTAISQFGVGFLTAFMIGERVEVTTRSSRVDARTYAINLEDIYDLFLVRVLDDDDLPARPVRNGGTEIRVFLRKGTDIGGLREQVEKWIVFLEFPIQVSEDDRPADEVWGLRGETPEEVGESIAQRLGETWREYCPMCFSKDGVNVTILWEGVRSGTRYLLAPAGGLLLPLTENFKRWDQFRDEKPKLIQKVANGGIFLTDELPVLKFPGQAHIHCVVDCREEKRFTPLVSRSGVAIDGSCVEIVSFVVEGLIDKITESVLELLDSGVSKYFAGYYAGQALGQLFERSRTQSQEELVLSVLLAVRYGSRVPTALLKEGEDIRLKSWEEHCGAPVSVGRNVYASLLRSVSYGYVEFPLPQEVLRSLPEHFLVDVGTKDVLRPMFVLAGYGPVALEYDDTLKGVFLRCEAKQGNAGTFEEFAGLRLLQFPDGLQDAVAVTFELAECLNKNHEAMAVARRIVGEIVAKSGEGVRAEAEERVTKLMLQAARGPKQQHMRNDDEAYVRHFQRDIEGSFGDNGAVRISLEDARALVSARVIREDLWSQNYEG